MKKVVFLLSLLILALSVGGLQAITPEMMLEQLFTQEVLEDWLAPSFKSQVPLNQIVMIISQVKSQLGELQGMDRENGKYLLIFEEGILPAQISLDGDDRIQGLFFEAPRKTLGDLEEILSLYQDLPGKVSLLVTVNGEEMLALNPKEPLAVGSSFKLAVLAALSERIEAGDLSWSCVVELKEEHKTLPSGVLQDWPIGSPLTLHTLALQMISISDNTATDALILLLGRDSIEEISLHSRPFLTTREAFILKNPNNQDLLDLYRKAEIEERRSLLEDLADRPMITVEDFDRVRAIDIEWFFSVRELAQLIERVGDLPLMSINPGLASREDWAYVAYKGGAEPGVLNFTTLLEGFSGHRYIVSATWNDEKLLDDMEFVSLYTGLLNQIKEME